MLKAIQVLKDYPEHKAQMVEQVLKVAPALKAHLAHPAQLAKVVSVRIHLSIRWK